MQELVATLLMWPVLAIDLVLWSLFSIFSMMYS